MYKFRFKPTRSSRLLGRGLSTKSKRRRMSSVTGFRKKGLRAGRLLKYNVHAYKRMATIAQYDITSPAFAYNSSFAFTLSDVRNSSELTALYDQYMITGVKVRFSLVNNPDASNIINATSQTNSANFYPKLFYVRDYDDIGTEAANDLRERNNVVMKLMRPNQFISFFIRPAVRNQVYLDGVTPATSPVWNQWLDCSSSQVPHYGVKFCVDFQGFSITQNYYVRVEKTYYLKFKNSR